MDVVSLRLLQPPSSISHCSRSREKIIGRAAFSCPESEVQASQPSSMNLYRPTATRESGVGILTHYLRKPGPKTSSPPTKRTTELPARGAVTTTATGSNRKNIMSPHAAPQTPKCNAKEPFRPLTSPNFRKLSGWPQRKGAEREIRTVPECQGRKPN
jgi:hypothetical protein